MNISAYRENDEPWRIERLLRLAQIIVRQWPVMTSGSCKVIGLFDHKGDLRVTLDRRPGDAGVLGWLQELWVCTENEAEVSFSVGSDELSLDFYLTAVLAS